jgi:hypothetical protein
MMKSSEESERRKASKRTMQSAQPDIILAIILLLRILILLMGRHLILFLLPHPRRRAELLGGAARAELTETLARSRLARLAEVHRLVDGSMRGGRCVAVQLGKGGSHRERTTRGVSWRTERRSSKESKSKQRERRDGRRDLSLP